VHWLYAQQVPKPADDDEWERITGVPESEGYEDVEVKLQVYSLGDRLLASEFRRAINKTIVDDMTQDRELLPHIMPGLIDCAFTHVPSDRPLQQLLVNKFCDEWKDDLVDASETEGLRMLPANFVARIMRRYSQLQQHPNSQVTGSDCCYLEHTDDELESCTKVHMEYDPETDFGCFERC
jgi:hypothetical protein